MTEIPYHCQSSRTILCISGTLLSLILLTAPSLAHRGHGDEFHQAETEATGATSSIRVDAETAKRLGIKVEPAKRQRLAMGIQATGQIETLPNKQVEVTAPISQAIVVKLLVEPGAQVAAGQPVAVLAAPELVELRVASQERLAETQAGVQQAQADLKLAQENLKRQQRIAAANIAQARTEVQVAQEQYDRDMDLLRAGAIPRRQWLESQAHLDEGKAQLATAASRREVLEAEAQLKRAAAAMAAVQSRLNLSTTTYQTRLQQLGTKADAKGLVTVTAPISGRVSDREATLGQSFEDAGGKLMTIVNDSQVFATANIYEKDLDKVKIGQRVNVSAANLPDRIFTGRVAVVESVVEGETRVVPVKAVLDNSSSLLKPGIFAEVEVLTNRIPTPILAIKSSAVVDANGKKLVYLQNGNAYQPVEVNLGQMFGDMVEIKSGLFEGDLIVTQRAPQLYAQSLRSGVKAQESRGAGGTEESEGENDLATGSLPWWLVVPVGGAIAAGAFWAGRRSKPSARRLAYETSNSSVSPHSSNDLPESHNGASCESPILANSDRHHSSPIERD